MQGGEQLRTGARIAHAAQRTALFGQEDVGVGHLGPQHRDRHRQSLRELRRRRWVARRRERLADGNVADPVIVGGRVVVDHDWRLDLDLARNHLHLLLSPHVAIVSRNLPWGSSMFPIKLPETSTYVYPTRVSWMTSL